MLVCGSGCNPLGFSSPPSFSMKELAPLHFFFYFVINHSEHAIESL